MPLSSPTAEYRKNETVVAMISETGHESVLRWYARIIGGRRSRRTPVARVGRAGPPLRRDGSVPEPGNGRLSIDEAAARLTGASRSVFLVADWGEGTEHVQHLLRIAAERDMPAVLVRQISLKGLRRVVVATGGGPHASRQMWVAKEISSALSIPLRVVRLVRSADHTGPCDPASGIARRNATLEDWTSGLLGIESPAEVLSVPDLARGIVEHLRLGDLLVMGAPGPFYGGQHFPESIPGTIARRVRAPILLLRSRRPDAVDLRNVFWGRLTQPQLRVRTKPAVLRTLVNSLVEHHQVPASAAEDLIERAVQREWVMSTAVDCETAFPHIRLPGFRGVAGSMAVCPDGVDFGSADGAPTRFFFLLVTPDGYCDEHLTVQAKIARRMLRSEVRASLLDCATAEEILNVLEPRDPS